MGSWQLFNKNLEQREGRAKDIFGLKPAPIVPDVQRLSAVQSLAAVPCSRFNGVKADARSKGSNRSICPTQSQPRLFQGFQSFQPFQTFKC